MIYRQHQQTFEEYRQVRFIQMEENENGETEVISTTDQRFTPREVLGGAFAIPGAPKPFLIEDDGQIIERVIHHINTRFSETIDVYFQEVYTEMIAEGLQSNLNQYIGKKVSVKFYSNGVLENVQMPRGTITISSEMDEVWRFAFDHFFTNEQVENDDTLVLKMEYETNNISSLGYDGTLKVHYDVLTRDEAFLELFCEVCHSHFDGHDATAVDNHERCEEHAGNGNQSVAQNSSDPDASFENDSDSDSEEEETDSEGELEDGDVEEAEDNEEAEEAEEAEDNEEAEEAEDNEDTEERNSNDRYFAWDPEPYTAGAEARLAARALEGPSPIPIPISPGPDLASAFETVRRDLGNLLHNRSDNGARYSIQNIEQMLDFNNRQEIHNTILPNYTGHGYIG